MEQKKLIALFGPSGCGKDTIKKNILMIFEKLSIFRKYSLFFTSLWNNFTGYITARKNRFTIKRIWRIYYR